MSSVTTIRKLPDHPAMGLPRSDLSSSSRFPESNSDPNPAFPFLIRTARQQDLVALADVLADSFHAEDGWMGWMYPLFRMGIYEDLRNRLRTRHKHYACLVAVRRPGPANVLDVQMGYPVTTMEAIAGTVEIGLRSPSLWQPFTTPYLYLSNVAVCRQFRQQGVAFRLLQTCEQVAQQWGFQDLYLHVLEDNHAARRLYHKAGYRVQRTESSLGFWVLGRPRQLLMHKPLQG